MEKKEYNGWYNYETWLFNLWFDGAFTEEAQTVWDEAKADDTFNKEENACLALSERIEAFADEVCFEGMPDSGFQCDLFRAAMQEINYYEIAKHYIEDLDQ